MANEIERKFLVQTMPSLEGAPCTVLERHFLYNGEGVELRIQSNGTGFKLQRKVSLSDLERTKEELVLTEPEFNALKQLAISGTERESYHLEDNPATDIRIYHGAFEGLIRAEFEFETQEEALRFRPPSWVGAEITGTPLARDSLLLSLEPDAFKDLLALYSV